VLTTTKEWPVKVPATRFLNVDLDIFSNRDLQPLVDAFGKKISVLYSGRVRRTHRAHVELAKITKTADATVRDFCTLIDALPKTARDLWSQAKQRDFNIGIQAGMSPYSSEFVLAVETLKMADRLGARIVFTVYAPERPRKPVKSKTAVGRPKS
jgi:hypothetical protein